MAVSKSTRKFFAYRSLFRLNRAVLRFEWNLIRLMQHELIPRESVEIWQARVAEVQAEINKTITLHLHRRESLETRRVGQIVETWEEGQPKRPKKH